MRMLLIATDLEAVIRDDIVLRCDVYRPDDVATHPVLLARTPHNAQSSNWAARLCDRPARRHIVQPHGSRDPRQAGCEEPHHLAVVNQPRLSRPAPYPPPHHCRVVPTMGADPRHDSRGHIQADRSVGLWHTESFDPPVGGQRSDRKPPSRGQELRGTPWHDRCGD